ncbi:hypothetical protein ABPG74_019186 [Tetrahymena malaccensis]
MLEGLNNLHVKNIMHRDIKPQNYLVCPSKTHGFTIKLCDLGFASAVTKSKSFYQSKKGTDAYFAPEVELGQSRIQSDLYSLGIVLLELDNLDKLNENWIDISTKAEIYEGKGIASKYQINRKSNIYKIAQTCLKSHYLERKSAGDLLSELIQLHGKPLKFVLTSMILKEQIPQQAQNIFNGINELQKNKQFGKEAKQLLDKIDSKIKKNDSHKQFTNVEILSKLLQNLYEVNKYANNFQILNFGSYGMILATKKIEFNNKEIVLKIQKIENENKIQNEISIMKQLKTTLVVQLYDSYIIEKATAPEKYIVFELEKCSCTLQEYLERQKKEGEFSDDQKLIIASQLIDSVNYIHWFSIIHRDIKPENFLVCVDGNQPEIKLCDFGLSAQLENNSESIEILDVSFLIINYYQLIQQQSQDIGNLRDLFQYILDNNLSNDQRLKEHIAIQMLDGDLGFATPLSLSKSFKSIRGTEFYMAPELEDGQFRIQVKFFLLNIISVFQFHLIIKSDIFSIGLILLQLDNLNLYANKWLNNIELVSIYKGHYLWKKKSLNRNTNLHKIIEICLKKEYNNRKTVTELLEMLINIFQIIGFGGQGIILATWNKKIQKDIVLKIQQIENEKQINDEIRIMKMVQMPLITEFYSHYYLQGLNNRYVVYELERCTCDFGCATKLNNLDFIETEQSDIFSVGLVLCLVDNYLAFSQDQNKYPLSYYNMISSQFTIPFDPQTEYDNQDKLNRQSRIYEFIQDFLVYQQENRIDLLDHIEQNPQNFLLIPQPIMKTINIAGIQKQIVTNLPTIDLDFSKSEQFAITAKKNNQIQKQIPYSNMQISDYFQKNGYLLQEKLGQGCISEVYRAIKIKQKQQVAIKKLISMNNMEHVEEFNTKRHILNKIKSQKYALHILDCFEDLDSDVFALVVDYYDYNLGEVIEQNKFSFEQLVALTYQLLKGLLVFQESEIVHGKIKAKDILYSQKFNQFTIGVYMEALMTHGLKEQKLKSTKSAKNQL